MDKARSVSKKIKHALIGKARNPLDHSVFHHLSLIAFFAWVGLGADGLSSSCYGPEEAFLALGHYPYLSLFIAAASAITVFLISSSYSQIIELFPTGGGGYLVASKLLSPSLGMISGCALLIDYILTITISVASGADALFSFLPAPLYPHKLVFAIIGVLLLILMNLRGVKESVMPLVPIFMVFVVTHFIAILYVVFMKHAGAFSDVAANVHTNIQSAFTELGVLGTFFLILRAYSMGAGTYTGIEAVSNGLPILREPRVKTGKSTMRYMSISLAFTVGGLLLGYLLLGVHHEEGKTLNATLFGLMTENWPNPWGTGFVWVALFSEALLLFVAAQAGFLDGPRVLANMALDRWFPTKFASLSDRLVTQNGVLLMGGAALITMILTKGSVKFLVVLYSINVFITFCLSQTGMVRHWWQVRRKEKSWLYKIAINGSGLFLTTSILVSMVILKFHEGGWMTLLLTGALVAAALVIKSHYLETAKLLRRLNNLVHAASAEIQAEMTGKSPAFNPDAKTAVILVNGFNGLGLHTLFSIIRWFGKEFKNFVFVQVGILDAGNFKGIEEMEALKKQVAEDARKYREYMNKNGFYADTFSAFGIDIMEEIEKLQEPILEKFPNAVFFGGQLVFPRESLWTRWLHNYTVFAMQRRFYQNGIPFVILPVRV